MNSTCLLNIFTVIAITTPYYYYYYTSSIKFSKCSFYIRQIKNNIEKDHSRLYNNKYSENKKIMSVEGVFEIEYKIYLLKSNNNNKYFKNACDN